MKRITILATILLLVFSTGGFALADDGTFVLFDGGTWHFPKLLESWHARKCWCPDDYCPKRLPAVPCVPKGCVDEYCRKSLPCVPVNQKGCVDDYCPKACPIILWRCSNAPYTCGPAQNGCAPSSTGSGYLGWTGASGITKQ